MRQDGAAEIHPSAKLKLYGLLMQARSGDCPLTNDENAIDMLAGDMLGGNLASASIKTATKGFALTLEELKLNSWRAAKGKKRKESMEEYITLLTSLAPQWKIAGLVAGREGDKPRAPKQMVWVLKVVYESSKGAKGRRVSVTRRNSPWIVSHIEVVQASSASNNAKLWCEEQKKEGREGDGDQGQKLDKGTDGTGEDRTGGELRQKAKRKDSYIERMPKDLTVDDCIIDPNKHKTIDDQVSLKDERVNSDHVTELEMDSQSSRSHAHISALLFPCAREQREYFRKLMLHFARSGHDREDGWVFQQRTSAHDLSEEDQVDVYDREVDWSVSVERSELQPEEEEDAKTHRDAVCMHPSLRSCQRARYSLSAR